MESSAIKIREDAKRELGNWFKKRTSKGIQVNYRIFRSLGMKAADALWFAKYFMEKEINELIEYTFNSHIPQESEEQK